MEIISLIFASVLTNNIILSRNQGYCSFLGVSKKTDTAVGMGLAVIFVMAITSLITYLIYYFILLPLKMEYIQLLIFILTIACLVQLTEIVMKRFSPVLYRALGVYLPLITTNCAILGTANLMITESYNLIYSFVISVAIGAGYLFAIFLLSCIREKTDRAMADIPQSFRGFPITLITAAIMALAFLGFTGII